MKVLLLTVMALSTVSIFWLTPRSEFETVSATESEAAEIAEVVQAKKFQLLDENGKVAMEMKMDDGHPVFLIKDDQGKNRIEIFHQPKATGIYIKDVAGHTRIGVAQFPHGGGIAMHGEKSKGAAVYVLMNNEARLDVYDVDGKLKNRWPGKSEYR